VEQNVEGKHKSLEASNLKVVFRGASLTNLPPLSWNRLSHLQMLKLSDHKLESLPDGLGELSSSLNLLNVANNKMKQYPPVLFKLRALKHLDVSGNPFPSDVLPKEFGKLKRLKKLNISNCNITGLPSEFSQLTRLVSLNLSRNPLPVIAPEIFELQGLTELCLEGNKLAEIPPKIESLSKLQILKIDHNHLTELPTELGKLPQLKTLVVTKNKFKATSRIKELSHFNEQLISYLREQVCPYPPFHNRDFPSLRTHMCICFFLIGRATNKK
jgi:hypothetical protein